MSTTAQKSNLEKFYQGWPHFKSMNKGENFIVLKVDVHLVNACMLKAKKRIDELKLPLEVLGTGAWANTFIVRDLTYRAGEQFIYNVREARL